MFYHLTRSKEIWGPIPQVIGHWVVLLDPRSLL